MAAQDHPVRLLVTNLPVGCYDDTISVFFESKRTFGRNLTVNHVDYDESRNSAIVKFGSNKDLQTVLNHHETHPCCLKASELSISVYKEHKEAVPSPTRTIEVRGYPKTSHVDSLRYYFENKSRSGGGNIDEIAMETGDDETIHVTFCDAKVVESVMRKEHKLQQCDLHIRPLNMSDTELFLTNIPAHIPEETVKDFLAAKFDNTAISVTYNKAKDAAVVQFEFSLDFAQVPRKLSKSQLGGRILEANKVQVTNSLIVTNIPATATEEAIRHYFENKRRSKGGDVEKITYVPIDGYCLIHFKDEKDVLSTCSLSEHRFRGSILRVSSYHKCLGAPTPANPISSLVLPEPIIVEKETERMLRVLQLEVNRKETFETQLREHHAKLCDYEKKMMIECTLTPDSPSYRQSVMSWSSGIHGLLRDSIKDIITKSFQLDAASFQAVVDQLKHVALNNPRESAVFKVSKTHIISLVSFNRVSEDTCRQIQTLINTVKQDVYVTTHRTTRTNHFKTWQIQYLVNIGYGSTLENKYENLTVILDTDNSAVNLQGVDTNVTDAALNMYEVLERVKEHTIKLDPEAVALLDNKDISQRINKNIERKGMVNIWKVKRDSIVAVVTEDTDHAALEEIFRKFYTTLSVSIRTDSVLRDTEKLNTLLQLLSEEFGNAFKTTQRDDKMTVYTTPELVNAISDHLDRFLSQNSIYEEMFRIDENTLKFVQKSMPDELSKTVADIQRENKVTLDYTTVGNVHIKGTKNGIKLIRNLFERLSKKVYNKQRKMGQPGIKGFLTSNAGKEALTNIEDSTPCLILQKTTKLITTVESFNEGVRCSESVLQTGQKFIVYGGDMSKLTVDVIVNASNIDMKHHGGLAAAIVKVGGQSIQDECSQYIVDNGPLDVGGIFMGQPAGLPCKAVAHAVGPQWHGGNRREQTILQRLVKRCLKETDKRNMTSIAFPALCTGMFRYPIDKSCTSIVTSILKYFNNTTSGIKEVYLCDINVKTVHAFIKALKTSVGTVTDLVQLDKAILHQPKRKSSVPKTQQKPPKPCFLVGQTTVELVHGDMRFEKVDIIVNSTSPDLKMNKGQASKALLNTGGDGIQTECDSKFPNGITHGEVAATSPGKLSCKGLFHVAVKPHKDAEGLQIFQTTVSNCLLNADKQGKTSIAFPAIGTGVHQGFPKDVSASTILKCVTQHCINTPNTTLTKIRVVIYKQDTDTYDAFVKEFKTYTAQYPSSQPAVDTAKSDPGPQTVHLGSTLHGHQGKHIETCVLTVYADSVQRIEKVFTRIENVFKTEWYTQKIEDNAVWRLDQTQVQKIDTCAKKNDVYVCVDQDIGAITVEGILKNATNVMDVVCEELRVIDRSQHEHQHAQLKAKLVKWVYDNGASTVDFPEIENYRIELAHENKDTNIKLKNTAGDEYNVDFKNMQMSFSKQPGTNYKVYRHDLVKGSLSSFKFPSDWDPMNPGEKVKLLPLAATSAEYQNCVAEFQKTLGRVPTILKVERVQNLYLFAQYQYKYQELNVKNPGHQNERVLWHGTQASVIQNIITNGFNRSYLSRGAYGAGAYFAVNASYSDGGYARPDASGHKRMMRVLVLVGHSVQGVGTMTVLPERQPGILYDSAIGPSMYIIFSDTQAYAQHIITYT